VELKATIDDADFQKAMTAFPSIAKKELRLALYSTSHSVVLQAQAEHRFKTKGGNLEKSIQSRMSPEDELAAEVFFNEGIATYGKYQHDGTGPHQIKPKNKKSLYFVSGGTGYFSKGVNHPGIKPDPFITNAAKVKEPLFNKNISNAVNATITAAGLKS
jgi:hypothetical protein